MLHRESQTEPDGAKAPSLDADALRRTRRRLLLEAAIEEGYPARLEQRVTAGRTSTRIVQPVELEIAGDDPDGPMSLVTRTPDQRLSRYPLDEIDEVTIVTTRFRAGQERRGRWSVGDAVVDAELGVGVVQAFRDGADGESAVVRFARGGPRPLPLTRDELRPAR